ncbi:MAG: hypothetical protein HOP08_17415 [Cyclobacteriaceae bacterium]|nr:hypothetical protein [Cyclobacteriaceae bacterium]
MKKKQVFRGRAPIDDYEEKSPTSIFDYQNLPNNYSRPQEPKPPLTRMWEAFEETQLFTVLKIAGVF